MLVAKPALCMNTSDGFPCPSLVTPDLPPSLLAQAMAESPAWFQWQHRKSSTPLPNPTLVEVHEWVLPSHCHRDDCTLRHGQLLRWMDIAACLSAERHAKLPCVTVSIDDITFETTVSVGHVVILKAVVNRAFTTSMEVGLCVHSEDPFTGKRQQVCKAYSVFVAKPEDKSKVKLPPVDVRTEEENREYLLAAERRRMRITYAKDIQKVVKRFQEDSNPECSATVTRRKVPVSKTQVHTVKIVLPVHANHHGTTFGGQIMEWMTDIATISGIRLARSELVLEGIESVHFRGPSFMGERVSLQSSVNKVFSTRRFEVGVRVEGFAVGGESRHINSAFFTFRPQDDSIILPDLIMDTQVEEERAANAVARHYLWLDRRAIHFEERQVMLNSENVYELILKNTTKLMSHFAVAKWEMVQSTATFDLLKNDTSDNLVLRLNGRVEGVGAREVFHKITNYSARPKWDFLCKSCRSFRRLSVDDELLHMAFHSPRGGEEKAKDFVLLVSKRAPQELVSEHQYFIVAYSSVLCSDMPPLEDYERSQVISSGYIVEDSGDGYSCKITYLHQVGSSIMPFVAKDLLGMSSYVAKVYANVLRYLTE